MRQIADRTYTVCQPQRVAFLGLGVMGYPMAGHLATASHQVTVYNRTATKSEAWCAEFAGASGQKHAKTPREAAQGAEIVFCCVGNDDDLRSVTTGPQGAFSQPIARLLARKATQRTARDRAIADRRE